MTKPLVTRGELKDLELSAPWMLTSGQRADPTPMNDFKSVQAGIQLYVPIESGRIARLNMDVHDAGDLYVALEAHMENVAAPPTPEGEDFRKLHMVPEKDWRKGSLGVINGTAEAVDPEFLAAMEDVLEAWTKSTGPFAREEIRANWPTLVNALDRLAALNA